MTAAVAIDGLTKDFKLPMGRTRFRAVDDLSFTVNEGEVYGLLGPNGSGKSTTMKMLLGLVKPTAGRCAIFGKPTSSTESREDVGFLPESPYFYKHLSGRETLRFYGKLCGLAGNSLTTRIGELLELVGLEEAADRRLAGYSKGMLQRIGLAQALVHDPRLIVLDEPTAGVDPAGSRQIRDLILNLKRLGNTVILSSHLLEQVQEVCDRVGILNRGRMVREGILDELIAIGDQFEVVFDRPGPELERALQEAAAGVGARILRSGNPHTTLESLFLDATGPSADSDGKGGVR
jgi:ABC-2 type transport system ATP-binding protein